MNDTFLNNEYWSNRYAVANTGWDIGKVSTPLKAYIDQLTHKQIRICIPGCGNAYEAMYLLEMGFSNITLVDIASNLVTQLQREFSNTPVQVIHGDFFEHQGMYDLILEQTFFCAIHPSLRPDYVRKMHDLLDDNGILAGVLFNRAFNGGPPFGGTIDEYASLFDTYFHIRLLEPCYNSIPPRAGTEAFMIMHKKAQSQ